MIDLDLEKKIVNEIRIRFSYIVSLSKFYRLYYYECLVLIK